MTLCLRVKSGGEERGCVFQGGQRRRGLTLVLLTAVQIWELGQTKQNTMEFAEAVDDSDLEAFGFTDDFIFELWGAITDAKAGRLKK